MSQRIQLPQFTRDASFSPSTADAKRRTVEVVWTRGAKVRRGGFFGPDFDEELSLEPGAVRLDRLNNGASLLDSHRAFGLDRVLGVVEGAAIVGPRDRREGRATVRFSDRAEVEPIWRDVQAGIIRNVSVGYRIHRAERTERPNEVPLIRATDWEPLELSLVAVPADAGAQVRAADQSYPCEVVMAERQLVDASGAPIITRAATAATAAAVPEADPVLAERERAARIEQMCRVFRMPAETGQALIAQGIPADDAYRAMLEAADGRDRAGSIVSGGADIRGGHDHADPGAITARMVPALLHRADPARYELPEAAREFRGASLIELRRILLEAQGVRCRGWSVDEVLGYQGDGGNWLRAGGLVTSSDLPTLLQGTGARLLEDAYAMAASPLKAHSRERSAADFRTLTMVRAGNISALAEVNEHGEVTRGQPAESKEAFAVKSYAKIWGFTRQAIINDDLGGLADWASEMGAAAGETEAGLFVGLLTAGAGAGPVMDDGTVLFHANHGNLAASGTTIDVTNVGAARQAMREQTGIGGVFPIQVAPVAIVVGPARELLAEQVTVALTPATTTNANPFSGKLSVEVEPRLSGNAWYLFSANPAFMHAFLNGQRGPMLSTREGFDVLGVEFRCVLDFGVGVRDYRFVYRNPGA